MRFAAARLSALALFALASSDARAWGDHFLLMPFVHEGLSPAALARVDARVDVPCPADETAIYQQLAAALELAQGSRLPALRDQLGSPNQSLKFPNTARRLSCKPEQAELFQLIYRSVDEPDGEMDWMPESYDPHGDRRYMGGFTGDTGKGFRHMYFGGWKLKYPITSFQVPARALGEAPTRITLLASAARERIRAGDMVWGMRLLTWSMHYLQDLAQPFHSVQVVSPSMIPWGELFQWPPARGFGALVKESNRTVANYHFAFEAYVEARLRRELEARAGKPRKAPFAECMTEAEKYQNARFPEGAQPADLVEAVRQASIELAPRLGRAELEFFGDALMKHGVDLPNHVGAPDFATLVDSPALADKRALIDPVACSALANGISASRKLIEWALNSH